MKTLGTDIDFCWVSLACLHAQSKIRLVQNLTKIFFIRGASFIRILKAIFVI